MVVSTPFFAVVMGLELVNVVCTEYAGFWFPDERSTRVVKLGLSLVCL